MKNTSRLLLFVLTITTVLLSACGGVVSNPAANSGSGKVEPIPVAFIGVVDSIAGDQWVINGQAVTVSPDVLRDSPFRVGDSVKVEGVVNTDGSFTVSRVEVPTPKDSSSLPQFGDDNSNDSNTNDANINDGNINDDNGNGVNTNESNTNDDNGNDANINDDNSNGANTNDDTNINDDNGNDSNSNDEHGGNTNSDDNDGNEDNSGSGGNDNGGGDNGNGGSDDSGGGNDDNGNDG